MENTNKVPNAPVNETYTTPFTDLMKAVRSKEKYEQNVGYYVTRFFEMCKARLVFSNSEV
jgi:hypothetical protein